MSSPRRRVGRSSGVSDSLLNRSLSASNPLMPDDKGGKGFGGRGEGGNGAGAGVTGAARQLEEL
jgi:hypothetical protein